MTELFLGGSIANTISDVPNAIDRMVKNYKKIATGKSTNIFGDTANIQGSRTFKIPLNLSFVPSKLYCSVWSSTTTSRKYFDGTLNSSITTQIGTGTQSDLQGAYIKNITSQEFTVWAHFRTEMGYYLDFDWIAIE